MSEIFYLFTTYVPHIHKFGFTGRTLKQRMSDYYGVNKPQQIVGSFVCKNGRLMEDFFIAFLKANGVMIDKRFGKEYFCYENDINTLYDKFYSLFSHTNTQKIDTKSANNSNKNKDKDFKDLIAKLKFIVGEPVQIEGVA